MDQSSLNYGDMMQRALRGVMADALSQVQKDGLPGEHHFYITYSTTHPAASIPEWLFEKYPDKITIVIQHEFEDLEVSPEGFAITMSFSNKPALLYVPFDAVLTFVDPSVEFGLKFEATEIEVEEDLDETEDNAPDDKTTADVVSLDQFRKN